VGAHLFTVESRLYVQVGTQKFGRKTERDVQVKIIFRIRPCKVFWTRQYRLDAQTSGTYNWETYNRLYCTTYLRGLWLTVAKKTAPPAGNPQKCNKTIYSRFRKWSMSVPPSENYHKCPPRRQSLLAKNCFQVAEQLGAVPLKLNIVRLIAEWRPEPFFLRVGEDRSRGRDGCTELRVPPVDRSAKSRGLCVFVWGSALGAVWLNIWPLEKAKQCSSTGPDAGAGSGN